MSDHDVYLEELVHKLHCIDERKRFVKTIITDPIWFYEDTTKRRELCDMIVLYEPELQAPKGFGVPIELKSGKHKLGKATRQVQAGFRYIEQVLDVPSLYGKVVYYHAGQYSYDYVLRDDRQ